MTQSVSFMCSMYCLIEIHYMGLLVVCFFCVSSIFRVTPVHELLQDANHICTFSNRENIFSVIMSCLRSSPNFKISRVGV